MSITAEQRFWKYVDREGPAPAHAPELGPCWLWTGGLSNSGYGRFNVRRGVSVASHRYAYERLIGPIPAGHYGCHRCDNPPCVNPRHLFIGTQADNLADCKAKGRTARGDRKATRHTSVEVAQIRAAYARGGVLQRELAERFGTSQSYISQIVTGRRWI